MGIHRVRTVNVFERFANSVDAVSTRVGTAASWVYPLLVLVLIGNVVSRYGFGRGFIELEELQWHLFAAGFLLAFAYTYAVDEHVRVDVLRDRFSPRVRAWIELTGCLVFLAPFCVIVAMDAWGFFWNSLSIGERSANPSGLPARYLIKGVLFFAMVLLAVQALGVAARNFSYLFRSEER